VVHFNTKTIERVHQLILSTFSVDDLRMLTSFDLQIDLNTVVDTGKARQTVVFNLVEWAIQHGRLVELVQAAAKHRPQREDLAALAREIAAVEANEKSPAPVPDPATVQNDIARNLSLVSALTQALLVALSVFAFATIFFQFVPSDPPRIRFRAVSLCVAIILTVIGIGRLLLDRRDVRKMWNDVVTPVRASIESKTSHRGLWRVVLTLYVICVAPLLFLGWILLSAVLFVVLCFCALSFLFTALVTAVLGDEGEELRFTNTQIALYLAAIFGSVVLFDGCGTVVWRRIKARIRRRAT
jgi:hypothetical protein